MGNPIALLRVSYWVGAITDGLAGIRMLIPAGSNSAEYRYALALGAALMFGWAFILLWADRKPTERKGVLLITVFVVAGLIAAEIYAMTNELVAPGRVIPVIIFLVALSILFCFSYFNATRANVAHNHVNE